MQVIGVRLVVRSQDLNHLGILAAPPLAYGSLNTCILTLLGYLFNVISYL
jgi:hypothetical protein